ncbi:MAG: glycosyltransferase family 2 protein [Verrucomicrobiia bacterium]
MACEVSIVIPVFNERDNILPLAREVAEAMDPSHVAYELLFVDDGSTDGTWGAIQEAQRHDARVRGLRHVLNCGQSSALWTGLQASTAPVIATMDGDRQNDPRDFPALLAALDRCDFVCGVRVCRQDNFLRRVSSVVARRARKLVLGVDFADTGCAVRVFRRTVLAGVLPFNGVHRFLPVLVHGAGARTLELPVRHRPRVAGVSKYGIWNRLGRGIADLLAVAWYQRRRLKPVAVERLPAQDAPGESAEKGATKAFG